LFHFTNSVVEDFETEWLAYVQFNNTYPYKEDFDESGAHYDNVWAPKIVTPDQNLVQKLVEFSDAGSPSYDDISEWAYDFAILDSVQFGTTGNSIPLYWSSAKLRKYQNLVVAITSVNDTGTRAMEGATSVVQSGVTFVKVGEYVYAELTTAYVRTEMWHGYVYTDSISNITSITFPSVNRVSLAGGLNIVGAYASTGFASATGAGAYGSTMNPGSVSAGPYGYPVLGVAAWGSGTVSGESHGPPSNGFEDYLTASYGNARLSMAVKPLTASQNTQKTLYSSYPRWAARIMALRSH
ncbi:MAG: hypothetical protein ACWGQW_26055, partial [bacterium]